MQENIPPAVRSHRKPGGISLRFIKQSIEGETVYLHSYVIPKGPNQDFENYVGRKPGIGPITRDEILQGMPILESSPFFIDLFAEAGGSWQLLHSLSYLDEGDSSKILVKYLQPRTRRGPILLLTRTNPHWKRWVLLGFPEGIRGKQTLVQDFLYGSEGNFFYTEQKFEKTDSRGFLVIEEETREGEENKPQRVTYRWDGERFTDPEARWFVIAATSKRKDEIEAFITRKQMRGTVEITRSERFPKLVPGLWIVIMERCRTRKAATCSVNLRRKAGLDCYAKQAF